MQLAEPVSVLDALPALPPDLVRLGFVLRRREHQTAIVRPRPDPKSWELRAMDPVPRYLCISSGYGVGIGTTIDETIRSARSVAGFILALNRDAPTD